MSYPSRLQGNSPQFYTSSKYSPMMDGSSLKGASCLEHLLRLKIIPDLKWNSCMRSTADDGGKMVGSLYRSSKYLTPRIYKNRIRRIMAHFLPYQAWSCPVLTCLSWESSKLSTRHWNWWMIFHYKTTFPTTKSRNPVVIYRYSHGSYFDGPGFLGHLCNWNYMFSNPTEEED